MVVWYSLEEWRYACCLCIHIYIQSQNDVLYHPNPFGTGRAVEGGPGGPWPPQYFCSAPPKSLGQVLNDPILSPPCPKELDCGLNSPENKDFGLPRPGKFFSPPQSQNPTSLPGMQWSEGLCRKKYYIGEIYIPLLSSSRVSPWSLEEQKCLLFFSSPGKSGVIHLFPLDFESVCPPLFLAS